MVTTPNYNLDIDSTLGGNNASDYVIPSQKAVKGYVDSQTGSAPTFANLTGSPYDNTNLADALDDKYDASNPDGYITGITSSDVTTALGYTPYNSTNPNGYQANKIETIKVNGTAQTITSKAVDISVPTNNNQLTNGAGYITSSALAPYALSADLSTVATSGSYNDLSDKPTIPAAQVNSDWNASSGVAQILNKPNLATVATSGSYNDLSNKPTIPSEVTESTVSGWGFTKNTGTVTSVNNVSPINGNVSLTIPDTSNLANKDLSNLSSTGESKFQAPLVSGTNIKTINNNSILGSGDLTLDGLPSQTGKAGKFLQTDGTNASWEEVQSGSSRNIGEIVASTIPLTDAGLHLLDGSLIQGSGIYSAFVDYIASIYDATANYFCTESEWQTSVTQYGVCGKFVYDSVNNTVRLPKYSNKIYTQDISSSAPVVGNGISLGLTDGTTNFGSCFGSSNHLATFLIGSQNYGKDVGTSAIDQGYGNPKVAGITTDGSKSGIIAQLSNITTSLDGYYYIVIATSTKTDIEVDIDEIATDLNSKADVDLSNVNNAGTSLGAGWAMPSNTYNSLTLGASGTQYTAPANGWYYIEGATTGGSNATATLDIIGNKISVILTTNSAHGIAYPIPVLKGDTITIYYGRFNVSYFRFIYAVGSESEAS